MALDSKSDWTNWRWFVRFALEWITAHENAGVKLIEWGLGSQFLVGNRDNIDKSGYITRSTIEVDYYFILLRICRFIAE